MATKIRVGLGYDVHALVSGRKLVLGGVEIPFARGLQGWSDADVLIHAVMDALLGAAALGDIGVHFPPGDPAYQDISSLTLLGRVKKLLVDNHWQIGNIDIMVMAEQPKLRPYMAGMAANLAGVLGIGTDVISIKAGTSEKLGFIGREEGIAAQAVVLIERTGNP
jgi:2-C-methyl-D-erythritol 2,4-cyclodiphosphate synthase